MKFYTYFRSSAAYRVRIALNLKSVEFDAEFIHLVKDGGMQNKSEYRKVNPAGLVPSLDTSESVISQSLAIIEYLDERYPEPRLLPEDLNQRAWVRSLSQNIACDVHPLNNLRVLNYLKNELAVSDADRKKWYSHWVQIGFESIEKQLSESAYSSEFCFGDAPTMADCCLVPQVYNAKRFGVDIQPFRYINRIYANCMSLQPFVDASPEHQPDAEV